MVEWVAYSTVNTFLAYLRSGTAGTSCPTSAAAVIHNHRGQTGWQYASDGAWKDGGISVTCESLVPCL